jgi:hypothetical protein
MIQYPRKGSNPPPPGKKPPAPQNPPRRMGEGPS